MTTLSALLCQVLGQAEAGNSKGLDNTFGILGRFFHKDIHVLGGARIAKEDGAAFANEEIIHLGNFKGIGNLDSL